VTAAVPTKKAVAVSGMLRATPPSAEMLREPVA